MLYRHSTVADTPSNAAIPITGRLRNWLGACRFSNARRIITATNRHTHIVLGIVQIRDPLTPPASSKSGRNEHNMQRKEAVNNTRRYRRASADKFLALLPNAATMPEKPAIPIETSRTEVSMVEVSMVTSNTRLSGVAFWREDCEYNIHDRLPRPSTRAVVGGPVSTTYQAYT